MPANLTPEYREAEKELKEAQSPSDKLSALKKMLSTIPKHKGTEKLQADLKRRIAQLKEDLQTAGKKKGFAVHVDKQGAAQIALVGPPNAGKSQLAKALSGVDLEVAAYPFTTREPTPVMMPFEDVQIQLVDLPPVCSTHMESWVPGLVRNADALLLVLDVASDELLEGYEDTLAVLADRKMELVRETQQEDAWVSVAKKKTRMIATKNDLDLDGQNRALLEELLGERFTIDVVSGLESESLETLPQQIYTWLDLVRVYSKPPQREPDMSRPFVLRRGSTLADLATLVHHDFADRLKFARVWGEGKYDGQRINRSYLLGDKDVVEMHI